MQRGYLMLVLILACQNLANANVPQIYQLELQGDLVGFFLFYTTVNVGNPPVAFTVTVDSGSSDFLIPDIACPTCYGGDPTKWYNSTSSSTSKVIDCNTGLKCQACTLDHQCEYTMNYVGIAESATVFSDVVTIDNAKVNLQFGAVYNVVMSDQMFELQQRKSEIRDKYLNYRDYEPYPEGIWGLGYPSLNVLGTTPLFDQMVNSGYSKNLFTLCLKNIGGMLTLGGIPPYHTGDIQWAALNQEYFYGVTFMDVQVNGKSLGVPPTTYDPKTSIVDSGTVMPTLPMAAFNALREIITNNCSHSNLVGVCTGVNSTNQTLFDGVCFDLTPEQIAEFPTVSFLIKGTNGKPVTLEFTPQMYLRFQYYCNPGTVGLGIDKDPDFSIIGSELMVAYHTIFDRENKRVGFANAKCPQ